MAKYKFNQQQLLVFFVRNNLLPAMYYEAIRVICLIQASVTSNPEARCNILLVRHVGIKRSYIEVH